MTVLNINRCGQHHIRRARKTPNAYLRLKRQAERLLSTEIAFVHRPEKGKPAVPEINYLESFLVEIRKDNGKDVTKVTPARGLLPVPSHLLTRDQERRLFLHMNYLKCRANALRSRINPDRPSRQMIDEIESLLADIKRIRDCLTECYLRLVMSIARKLSNSQGQFEELFSDGMPILMRCVELFDASRGYRFSTYVIPSVQRHLYSVLQRTQLQRHRFAATDAEILSNVAEQADGRSGQMLDHAAIVAAILNHADLHISARESLIFQRRFGLDGDATQTVRQIADDLGISTELVRQLQLRAMNKLQDAALSLNVAPE